MTALSSRTITKEDNLPKPLITASELSADNAIRELAIAALETRAVDVPTVLEDDEDLAAVTTLIGDVTKEQKLCEEVRKTTKQPYLDAGKVIDAYFNVTLASRLAKIATPLSRAAKAYLDKKAEKERKAREAAEAEARAMAAAAAAELTDAVQAGDVEKVREASERATSLDHFAAKAARSAEAKSADLARTSTAAGTATLAETWTFDDLDVNKVDLEALRPFLTQAAIEQALRGYIRAGRRSINGARIFCETSARFRT